MDERTSEAHGCAACGMSVKAREYHPFLACKAFESIRNGNSVAVNLRAVVEYGMKAQRAGVSLHEAMNNIGIVIASEVAP